MFDFLFESRRDEKRADGIIRYLNSGMFEVRRFHTKLPHHTEFAMFLSIVHVTITCRDGKIRITFEGFSNSDFKDFSSGEIERVKAEISSYLRGSHAAKWRHKVVGL